MEQIDRKLVYIKWIDSYGCSSSWGEISEEEPVVQYCYSVGWVIGESAELVMLAPHLSPKNKDIHSEEHACGDMTIPKVSIIKRTELLLSSEQSYFADET